jgi:hypothetical protein
MIRLLIIAFEDLTEQYFLLGCEAVLPGRSLETLPRNASKLEPN